MWRIVPAILQKGTGSLMGTLSLRAFAPDAPEDAGCIEATLKFRQIVAQEFDWLVRGGMSCSFKYPYALE